MYNYILYYINFEIIITQFKKNKKKYILESKASIHFQLKIVIKKIFNLKKHKLKQ
jgi:hypothetical protein